MTKTCIIAAHDPLYIRLLHLFAEKSGLHAMRAVQADSVTHESSLDALAEAGAR
jgi:hypothetical protein